MKRGTKIGLGIVGTLLAIQLVQLERTNPPVTADVQAPAEVEAVLRRACYDCHSNETRWPWYSRVAPFAWLLHRDVVEGRRELNFSTWDRMTPQRRTRKMKEVIEQVKSGEMPPWFYLPMHRDARLSDADKATLIHWAETTGQG